MKFVNAHLVEYTPDKWLAFDDVLLMPQHSRINSRKDKSIDTSTNLTENVRIHIPIVSSPMDCVTEGNMAVGMIGAGGAGILHRFYKGKYADEARNRWEADIRLMIEKGGLPIFSVGASPEDMEPVEWVLKQSKRAVVCVDVAHGHLQKAMDQVRRLRTTFGQQIEIIGGSISTPEAAMHLIQSGVSSLRVGIGTAKICSTRVVTGCGLPLFSSIMLIRRVLHGMKSNVSLIADGGIYNSGDIVKALAAGADCVMLGRKLAVAKESSAQKIENNGFNPGRPHSHTYIVDDQYPVYTVKYRGQASSEFMEENGKTATAEGVSTDILVNSLPSVKSIVDDLMGGVRSGMSYVGANNLTELYDKAVFVEQSYNSYKEGLYDGA